MSVDLLKLTQASFDQRRLWFHERRSLNERWKAFCSPEAAQAIRSVIDAPDHRLIERGVVGHVYGFDWIVDPKLTGDDVRFEA